MTIADQIRQEGRQEGLFQGKQEGLQEGLQEGRYEEKLSVAIKLLDKGMAISTVAEVTGLSTEKLQELQYQLLH